MFSILDKMSENHHFDAVLNVFKNQQQIIEQKSQEFDEMMAKYIEGMKNLQRFKQQLSDVERNFSQQKWKIFEISKLFSYARPEHDTAVENLDANTETFVNVDKNKNLQNFIEIGRNFSANIEQLDSDMEFQRIMQDCNEYDEKIEICKTNLAKIKEKCETIQNSDILQYRIPTEANILSEYYMK